MPKTAIGSTEYTDMSGITAYTIPSNADTTSSAGMNYTPRWSYWYNYYRNIPELKSTIDRVAMWVVGKGFETNDEKTKKILRKIKGNGKESFNNIIWNAVVSMKICGDFFAEIVKNKRGEIVNLKPLNAGTVTIKSDDKGMISGYEQIVGVGTTLKNVSWTPEEIFHLSWNKVGDDTHGISTIEKIKGMIDSKSELQSDLQKIFHRYAKPLWVVSVDTDDTEEIQAFKVKLDKTLEKSENMIVPKDTVSAIERVSIPQFSTLDPLPYEARLQNYFIMSEGIPEIMLGYGGSTTQANAETLYIAFQQIIEYIQLYLEEQIDMQLGLEVEFNFPAEIMTDKIANPDQENNQNWGKNEKSNKGDNLADSK